MFGRTDDKLIDRLTKDEALRLRCLDKALESYSERSINHEYAVKRAAVFETYIKEGTKADGE